MKSKSNFMIIYNYQTHTKNYVFYKCSKHPKGTGRAKVNRLYNEITIIEKCDKHAIHENIIFEEFKKLYKNKQFDKINFDTLIQKFLTILMNQKIKMLKEILIMIPWIIMEEKN